MKIMKRILALMLALMLFAGYLPVQGVQAMAEEQTLPVVEEMTPETEETTPEAEETIPAVEETTPEKEETAPVVEETIPEPVEVEPVVEETAPVVAETEPAAEEGTASAVTPEEAVVMHGSASQKASTTHTGGELVLEPGKAEFVEPEAVEVAGYDYAGEYLAISDGAMQVRKAMKARTGDFTVKVQFSWSGFSTMNDAVQAAGDNMYWLAVEHTGKPTEGDYLMKHLSVWDWDCSYYYYTNSYLIEATYDFDLEYMTSASQEAQVDARVKEILTELDLWAVNDYYKIKGVYNYLTSNVTYDYAGLENDYDLLKYSAYGALIDNNCVCQGYANAFYRLMLELGVDTRYVGGNDPDASHGWNIVKLGNVYYDVDSTWDAGNNPWQWFLICESIFSQTHVRRALYTTSDFLSKYPMASSNYSGAPAVSGKTGLMNVYGSWRYYKNGVFQPSYTGLVNHNGAYYYVSKGVVNWNYTGVAQYGNAYYYVSKGRLDWSYTGLAKHSNGTWYYIQKGKLVWGYTGLVKNGSTWYYVSNSRLDWNYTGLAKHGNTWYYVSKGRLTTGYNGLVQYKGVWYYVQNSKVNFNYTGLVKNSNGTWYYVEKGKINWNYNGVVKHSNGSWYCVQKGRVNWGYTGLMKHTNGVWYYISNGRIDWSYNGYVLYGGRYYKVVNGRVQ